MSLESRAAVINSKRPNLVAEVYLYSADQGGRKLAIKPGYGCPCFTHNDTTLSGWDAWMQLGDKKFSPGETRTVGFCFLSGEKAAVEMRTAGKFYLWESGFIGEAEIIA